MPNLTVSNLFNVGGVMMPRPFKANRLGHLGLYVADMDASHRFYSELLGFHETDTLPGLEGTPSPRGRFYTYNSDHHALVLIHNSVGKKRDERYDAGITINQLSFQVATLDEVVNAHRQFASKGKKIWRIGRDVPGSNWAVYFLDADRHTVELFYGMEQIGWNRRSKPTSYFGKFVTSEEPILPQASEFDEVRSLDIEGNDLSTGTRWSDADVAEYDVGGIRLPRPFKIVRGGPVSLFVRDIARAIEFYVETMGLALTEKVTIDRQEIAFLRAGTEHHSITLAPIELRENLGLAKSTTLLAHGLQLGSYSQLRDAVHYLEQRGCRRVQLPAEIHLGIDYAAHFVDPDGHLVQLYYYMEQVGWSGLPKPSATRRKVQQPWPETIEALSDSYDDRTFQGPIG